MNCIPRFHFKQIIWSISGWFNENHGVMALKSLPLLSLVNGINAKKRLHKCALCLTDFHGSKPRRWRMERVWIRRPVHFLFIGLFLTDWFSGRRPSLALDLGEIYGLFPLSELNTCQMVPNWNLGVLWTSVFIDSAAQCVLTWQRLTYVSNMTAVLCVIKNWIYITIFNTLMSIVCMK